MRLSPFCRNFLTASLIIILITGVTATAPAVEVGKRVFDSELAREIAFAEKFHGKTNLILGINVDADAQVAVQKFAEEFKTKYNTELVWQQRSQSGEKGWVIIDKSGYARWKHTDTNGHPTIETLKTVLAKLKRNRPLPLGSPAPDFSLTEADGKQVFTLSDYKGKKNVLVSLLLQTY